MAIAKKQAVEETIEIKALSQSSMKLRIIGTQPMFMNRMSEKAQQQLLVGGGKKTKAEKAGIKHNPFDEFRSSAQMIPDGPTALAIKAVAIKAAMSTAALETDGITKTSAQRLLFLPGELVPVYGVPQIRLDVVRSADINRTPDVRSRAFLPRWACEVEVRFIVPQLSAVSVITLLANAGVLIGLGDFRQEKGKGSYGSFRVVSADQQDDEWDDLVKNSGRIKQLAALANPEFANDETEELLGFYEKVKAAKAA